MKIAGILTLFIARAMTSSLRINGEVEIDEDGKTILITGTPLGKRKALRQRYKTSDVLVFEGNIPLKCDSDSGSRMHINSCMNLVGTPAEIRRWVETKNLNPHARLDTILACDMDLPPDAEYLPVFPEVPTDHAVVRRAREAAAAATA